MEWISVFDVFKIGNIPKQRATISAAQGGCQAEIGVSSAMAAAAPTECLGGSPAQAAEIAMEHHLGLTCDPIAGLVQIPCIERNCMGAIKAIAATTLALQRDPDRLCRYGVTKTHHVFRKRRWADSQRKRYHTFVWPSAKRRRRGGLSRANTPLCGACQSHGLWPW